MGAALRESVPRLAGRGAERRILNQAWEDTVSGRPRAVVVHGEAGVGKTRLVREMCRDLDGAAVLWGTCVRFGAASLPFAPVAGALQTCPADLGDDGNRGPASGSGDIAGLLATLGGSVDEPGRLLPVIDRAVNGIAAQRPAVVVVDDLHWADVSSLDVLAYLISGFRRQRLMLVGTCRDENRPDGHPLHGWLADMRRMPGFTEMHLDRLDLDETGQQVTGLFGRTADAGLVAEIRDRSGGNPYLTELLVQEMTGDEQTLPAAAPRALRQALMAMWHRLSGHARAVARVLAVGGRPVDFEVLARVVTDHGGSRLSGSLAEAEHQGVVRRRDTDGRYWFRHPLLAEVLYESMPPGEAARVHARYAAVLESFTVQSEERVAADLAVHHERAANPDDAYRWSLRAARFAAGLVATAEEATHLERACSLWPQVSERLRGSSPDRVDLLLRAGRAADRAGRLDTALRLVDQALAGVNRERQPLLASTLLQEWGHFAWQRSAPGRALRPETLEAVALTEGFPDSAERATALASLSSDENWDGLTESAVEHAEQAVRVARRSGSDLALAAALNARAAVGLSGPVPQSIRDAEEAARLARACGNTGELIDAAIWQVNYLEEVGSYSAAATVALEAFEEGLQRGDRNWGYFLAGMAAGHLLYLGRWDECRDLLRESLAARRGGIPGALVRMAAAQLAVRSGDVAQARQHLDRVLELIAVDFPGLRWSIATAGAEVLTAEGDPAAALEWLMAQVRLELAQDTGTARELLVWVAAAAADVAESARDRGEHGAADRAVADLDNLVSTTSLGPCSPDTEDVAHRLDQALQAAELARARGAVDQTALWERAVDRAHAAEARWDEARALWRWAQAATTEHQSRTKVSAILRRAHGLASEMGAAPLRAEIESLARMARIGLLEPAPAADHATLPVVLSRLTGREYEILRFLVAGRSNTEIAGSLVISAKTVSVHVSSILRKTGTTSRTEAAALARRLGCRGAETGAD